jgi:DNA primase
MIKTETVDRIFGAIDIVEVISDFVKLKRAGSNYKGFSPFANEKTPSFFVSPGKGIFKCFSSGNGGNAVKFLMELEKFSYPEALKYIANKYNIEVDEEELSDEDKKKKDSRESLIAVTDFAKNQFSKWILESEEGKSVGKPYFEERGFSEATIKKFELGFSTNQKDLLNKTALASGYKSEYLGRSGLVINKDDYSFDRFSGRVIFPIHSISGQVLGFGARILKDSKKKAKYLNSPESEIYHKSSILYGLYFAKQSINRLDSCYMVEGYTDVISMHQSGIENVVSSSGTSLTVEQIRLIKRFSKNITVIYDGDDAGIKASIRGIDLILEEGMNVKVLLLPKGEDPDSFSKTKGSEGFIKYIEENETDFITFKTKLFVKHNISDPIKRAKLISSIVKSISIIPDSITRSVYLKECSSSLDISEDVLIDEMNKIRINSGKEAQKRKSIKPKPEKTVEVNEYCFKEEESIIRMLIIFGEKQINISGEGISVSNYIIDELKSDDIDIENPTYSKIYEAFCKSVNGEQNTIINKLTMHSDPKVSSFVVDMLSDNYDEKMSSLWGKNDVNLRTEEGKLSRIIPELVLSFKNSKLINFINETQLEIIEAQKNNDSEALINLIKKIQIFNELKIDIAKKIGGRIINKNNQR